MVYEMTTKGNMVKESRLPSQDDSNVKLKRTRRPLEGSEDGPATDTSSNPTLGEGKCNFGNPAQGYGPKKPSANYENNYRLEPDSKFKASDIEHLVEEILVKHLKDVMYNPARCKRLSQELAALIMERIKSLQLKRYKLVAVVSIGSIKERPGMQFGSRCLWNQETDTFASVKFTNGSLFAVAMIYGLYYE